MRKEKINLFINAMVTKFTELNGQEPNPLIRDLAIVFPKLDCEIVGEFYDYISVTLIDKKERGNTQTIFERNTNLFTIYLASEGQKYKEIFPKEFYHAVRTQIDKKLYAPLQTSSNHIEINQNNVEEQYDFCDTPPLTSTGTSVTASAGTNLADEEYRNFCEESARRLKALNTDRANNLVTLFQTPSIDKSLLLQGIKHICQHSNSVMMTLLRETEDGNQVYDAFINAIARETCPSNDDILQDFQVLWEMVSELTKSLPTAAASSTGPTFFCSRSTNKLTPSTQTDNSNRNAPY